MALPIDPHSFEVTPAATPPFGVEPNFDHPQNIFAEIYLTLGLCLGISSVFVILRVWSRFFLMRKQTWDDWIMILAWVMFIPYIAVGMDAMEYGSGVHQWDVPLSRFFIFLKLANVLEAIYNPLIFLTKLSILLQYDRIFCSHKTGKTRKIIWALIALNGMFYLAVEIPQIWVCNPREKIWKPYLPGTCLNLSTMLIVGAIVNIVSDFSILVLPLSKIVKLQLTPTKKLGVCAIFATGLFACISSILRLVYNVRFIHSHDVTWELTPIALWTVAEIASAIICGCLPTVPLLFKQIGPKIKTTFDSLKLKTAGSKHLFKASDVPDSKVPIEMDVHRVTMSQDAGYSEIGDDDAV